MDIDSVVDKSIEAIRVQANVHASTWHLGEEQSWSVDQKEGTLVLSFSDGTVATTPVQIIGTLVRRSGSFLWAWANDSLLPDLKQHAMRLKAFGEEHGLTALTLRNIEAIEKDAWEFTALAAHLSGANGAYRGDNGGTLLYMTFGEITLKSDTVLPETQANVPRGSDDKLNDQHVIDFIKQYFSEMYKADHYYFEVAGSPKKDGLLDEVLQRKQDIYERYWDEETRDNQPGSVGWPSDFDLSRVKNWECSVLKDGAWRVKYVFSDVGKEYHYTYFVKRKGKALKISDYFRSSGF